MNKHICTRVAAGVLAVGIAVAVPGAAFASRSTVPAVSAGGANANFASANTSTAAGGSSTAGSGSASNPVCAKFSTLQTTLEGQLSSRVTLLNTLTSRVNGANATYLGSDKATLLADLSSELSGIQGLQPVVQGDTTCAELKTAAHTMVYTYRVYMVMAPQTDLTVATDTETGVAAYIQTLYPKIAAAIQAAQNSGNPNAGAAQASFTDLQSQVTAAQGAVSGLSAQLLAQNPSGAPGNSGVFTSARNSVTTARGDLKAARADIKQIMTDLKVSTTSSSGTSAAPQG